MTLRQRKPGDRYLAQGETPLIATVQFRYDGPLPANLNLRPGASSDLLQQHHFHLATCQTGINNSTDCNPRLSKENPWDASQACIAPALVRAY